MYEFTINGFQRLYDCSQYGAQNDLNITVSPPSDDFILNEDGSFILNEDGAKINLNL
jgi:hypothetical protein